MQTNTNPRVLVFIGEIDINEFYIGKTFSCVDEAQAELAQDNCCWPIIIVSITTLNTMCFFLARPKSVPGYNVD